MEISDSKHITVTHNGHVIDVDISNKIIRSVNVIHIRELEYIIRTAWKSNNMLLGILYPIHIISAVPKMIDCVYVSFTPEWCVDVTNIRGYVIV